MLIVRPIRKAAIEARMTPLSLNASRCISPMATPKDHKPLSALTPFEVSMLLKSLNLSNYMIPFQKQGVDGATLGFVHSEQEVMEMGIDMLPKARMFFNKLSELKVSGVPQDLIAASHHPLIEGEQRPFFPDSPRTDTIDKAVPATHSAALASVSKEVEQPSSSSGSRAAVRYSWVKHKACSSMDLSKPVHKITVRGVSGALEKRLNGDYDMYEEDEESGLHHVFRKCADQDIWLEYLLDKKCWQIKSTSSRGSKSCLAEQSCAVTKSMFVCEKAWMVHDGHGAFTEQASVKILPHVDDIIIFGVTGKTGNKINGRYRPSHEMHAAHPVFFKHGDPDMCIEYNATRARWQIKTSVARGGNSCLAENGEAIVLITFTPADVLTVWVVCEEGKFAADSNLHVVSAMRRVRLSGGFGKLCTALSGTYVPIYELSADQMVYHHEDRVDLYLEYAQHRHKWQIKPIASRGTLSCFAELTPPSDQLELEEGAVVPFDGQWAISENQSLQLCPDMFLTPLYDDLFVSFTTVVSLGESFDDFLTHCSGVYVPIDKAFRNFPVYKHRSATHLHYLRYDNTNQWWQVHCSTQLSPRKKGDKQNSGLGELIAMFQQGSRCDNPVEDCSGCWKILQEEHLDSNGATNGKIDVRIMPRPSRVHILDATGPRAALLNGLYDVADEVCDHMPVYKKRMLEGSALEATEIWIEYSASVKSWQLKRTADRGSPKAYATLTCVAPQFVDDNAIDASWTVFDTIQKQWVPQPLLRCWKEVYSLVVSGATGVHGDHINGQYEPSDQTFHDLPLYKKQSDRADLSVWMEFNKNLHSWQIKAEKDRGQNKAWAFVTTNVALRPEDCSGTWEVFDPELKWHSQPQLRLSFIKPEG